MSKSFGATKALRDVSLAIRPGEVHALIGENGAGKSTLMKVLSGAHPPDGGSIELDGVPFLPRNPQQARQRGIAMIYQELNLAPHLSVAENILLGEEPARWGWIDLNRRREQARRTLEELHHGNLPLDAPVSSLAIAEQQLVEIARALAGRPRVLIMDEPTSSLTEVDTVNLFAVIERLRDRGVSVIYISHFLEECRRLCDRYTVLRDGETVGSGEMREADLSGIIRLMVGRDVGEIYPRCPHDLGGPVLELRGVRGVVKPRSATLELRKGEILGIAGLVGAGRTETVRACFGLDKLDAGTVVVAGGVEAHPTPASSLARGVGLLSENRKEEGLMLNLSIAENLTITRLEPFSRGGLISGKAQRQGAQRWMEKLNVRAQGPGQPVSQLSGGNQQKVALARLLHHEAEIFLLDEPTRGIDVGSKAEIYRLISELASRGKAVLFISSYLPELLGVCDTIAVMCRGVLSEKKPAREWTEHGIISVAVGQESGGEE